MRRCALQIYRGTAEHNFMNHTAGIGIIIWPQWLEGSVGLRDVLVARNSFAPNVSQAIKVGRGTSNITVVREILVEYGEHTRDIIIIYSTSQSRLASQCGLRVFPAISARVVGSIHHILEALRSAHTGAGPPFF
jgi:hypothetical protein